MVQVIEWAEFSMARLSVGIGEKLGGTIEMEERERGEKRERGKREGKEMDEIFIE